MLLSWCAIIFGTHLLCTYGVVASTHAFVLRINNGTLSTNATSNSTSNSASNSTSDSIVSRPMVKANTLNQNRSVFITNGREPSTTSWEEIEKKLDADLSSVANEGKREEYLNAISYNSLNDNGKVDKGIQSVSTNITNPLLTRLIDEENILGETDNMIARIIAEKTFNKLTDMITSHVLSDSSDNNPVIRTTSIGTVNTALNELSSSILLDCNKLFSIVYGTEGKEMSPNNCLQFIGSNIKAKLLQDDDVKNDYLRRENVNTKKGEEEGKRNKMNTTEMHMESDGYLSNHNSTQVNDTRNELRNQTIRYETTYVSNTKNNTEVSNHPNLSYNRTLDPILIEVQVLSNDRLLTNKEEERRKNRIPYHILTNLQSETSNSVINKNTNAIRRHVVYSGMTVKSMKPRKRSLIPHSDAHLFRRQLLAKKLRINNKREKQWPTYHNTSLITRCTRERTKKFQVYNNDARSTVKNGYKRHVLSNLYMNSLKLSSKAHIVRRNRTSKKKKGRGSDKVHYMENIKERLSTPLSEKHVITRRMHKLSKRRLVSNHVPHHRDKNDTKFKTLSEKKKKDDRNRKVEQSGGQTGHNGPISSTTTQTTADADNKTMSNEVANEKVKEISTKQQGRQGNATSEGFDTRPNITPYQRPTISPQGINKTKQGVLQVNSEGKKIDKTDLRQTDTDSEYVIDNRYPNLGVFRHEKSHINEENTHAPDDIIRKDLPNNNSLVVYNNNGTSNNNNENNVNPNTTLKRILCFGDSLTKGVYAKGEVHHPYTMKLRELFEENKHINYNIINHGMTGECVSKRMRSRLMEDLETLPQLDLVVILGGTNDLLHEDCTREVDLFDEIKKLHTLVHKKGYQSVVVTIPESNVLLNGTDKMSQVEYNDAIEDVNQKLRMYAATEKIPICDLADEFPRYVRTGKVNLADMWDDKIHPNAKGYDRIGEIIYGDIKEYV